MSNLNNTTGNLKSPVDNTNLFFQKWAPKNSINRIFVFHHGLGDHSGRFQNLLDGLDDKNTAFYSLDARGHGNSPGIRGHADNFNHFAQDFGALIDKVKEENNGKKIFLFGQSMGGLILLDYLLGENNQMNIQGAIVSSPALIPVMDTLKNIKKMIANLIGPLIPSVILDSGLDVNFLSHDKDAIEKYNADPLVHGKISFRIGMSLFNVPQKVFRNAEKIKLPILILHGSADGIVSPDGSKELYDKISSTDKDLKIFDGLYHETFNEKSPEKESVLKAIKTWLDNR